MALRSPPVTLSKAVQPLITRSGSHPLAAEAIPPSGPVSSSSSPARSSSSLCKLSSTSTSPLGAWSKVDTSTWRSGSCRHQFRPFGSSSSARRSVLVPGAGQGRRIDGRVTWESDCCDCSHAATYLKIGADMRVEAKKPTATLRRGGKLGEGNSSRRGTGLSRKGSDSGAEPVFTCTSSPSASSLLLTSPTSSEVDHKEAGKGSAGESGEAEEDRRAAVSFVGIDNDKTDAEKSSRGPIAAVLEQQRSEEEESADSSQVESGSSSRASSALSSSVSSSSSSSFSSSAPSLKSFPAGKKGHGSGKRAEGEGSGGEKGEGGEGEKGKIYIGGIPPMVTKEDVAEFFAQCGKVDRIILIKGHRRPEVNRGFCFLYFAEPGSVEAAARAVAELNGADFQGHKLRVVADDGHFLRERNAVTDHRLRTGDDTFVFRSDWHRKRHEAGLRLRELLKSTKAASDPRAVQKAFEEIDKPRLGDFALLVTYHARRGDKHSARSTFERMRSLRIPPNDFVYTSLINSYVMAGDMRNAMNCLEEMELEGVPPNAATYTVLIHGHARQKDAVSAELMFERMKRAKISPLVAAYQVLIDAFCKADDVERIEKAMAEMEAQGLDPNLTIYNNLLSTFSRLGKTDKCLDSFTKLKGSGIAPNVVSYGCLIQLYSKLGDMTNVAEVVKQMRAEGISHTEHTYSMILNGLVQSGEVQKAYSIFEEMKRGGFTRDVVVYSIIINGFCKAGDMAKAQELVCKMKEEGTYPNHMTYTSIIDGYARLGDANGALETVKAMRKAGYRPNTVAYNCIIKGLLHAKNVEKAEEILREMTAAGVKPDLHTYTVMMDGLARNGQIEKAFEFFRKVKADGIKVDEVTYGVLVNACCKVGRMQTALALANEMRQEMGLRMNNILYVTLMDGWAQRGDVWEVADLMLQMRNEGLPVDAPHYCALIGACGRAGDMPRAMETVAEMERVGIKPSLRVFTALITGWARVGNPAAAVSVYRKLKSQGLKADLPVFHALLSCLITKAPLPDGVSEKEILSVCDDMKDAGIVVDARTASFWDMQLRKLALPFAGGFLNALQDVFPSDWQTAADRNYADVANAAVGQMADDIRAGSLLETASMMMTMGITPLAGEGRPHEGDGANRHVVDVGMQSAASPPAANGFQVS